MQTGSSTTSIPSGIRVIGSERWITFPNDSSKVVSRQPAAPAYFNDLSMTALGYSRYRFTKLAAYWVTNVGSNHAGVVSAGWSYDPLDARSSAGNLDELTGEDISVMYLATQQSVHTTQRSPAFAECSADRRTHNWYTVTTEQAINEMDPGEAEAYVQAYLYTVLEQSVASGTGGTAGYIHVFYEVEFIDKISRRMQGVPALLATSSVDDPEEPSSSLARMVRQSKASESAGDNKLLGELVDGLRSLMSGESVPDVRVTNNILEPVPIVPVIVPAASAPEGTTIPENGGIQIPEGARILPAMPSDATETTVGQSVD